jgi:hypothetical protein
VDVNSINTASPAIVKAGEEQKRAMTSGAHNVFTFVPPWTSTESDGTECSAHPCVNSLKHRRHIAQITKRGASPN